MYQIRCLFIHVNIIPDPTRTFKNGKGPHLPKIGDGPGPTFQKSTTGSDFPQIDNDCLFRRSGPAVDIWKVRARCQYLDSPGPLSIFERSGLVVNIWKIRARCLLEGQGPLSFWKVKARCRFLEGPGSLFFWKVGARCLFGRLRVGSGWVPAGLRWGFGSTPREFRVGSEWFPGRFWVVSGSAPGGLCGALGRFRWVPGRIRRVPRGFRVGSGWFPGSVRVRSGWVPGRLRVGSGSDRVRLG
jgi:hypothetical protein